MSVTVRLPEGLARRVEREAAERHMSAEQVALEAIESHFPIDEAPAGRRQLAFAAIGRSGSRRGAAEADELLAEGFGRD
jgi:predicted transcriptional regulator